MSKALNLLLFGASGRGKTHSAAAICRELVAHGIRGRFYGATDWVQQLQEAKQALKLNELLLKPDRYRFLVVDDIGYVSRDQQETRVLFELIAHRYGPSTIQPMAHQHDGGRCRPTPSSCPYHRTERRELSQKNRTEEK